MDYIHIMLENLAKVYKIKYRILESDEEKGYSDNSPSFHAYTIDDTTYLFDLSESNIGIEELEDLISYTLIIVRETINLHKNSSDIYVNTHDILTDTYNRAYFEKRMQGLTNAVLIAGDVNNLKVMNDIFGHTAGDNLLITAGKLLKEHAPNNYIIARCGGDEFNVIIPDGTIEEAKEYCSKIQNECMNYKGELLLRPQIAFGYAKQGMAESPQDAFKRADEYMYKNKTKLKEMNNVISELEQKMYESGYSDRKEMQNKLRIALSFGLYLNLPLTTLSDLAMAIKIEEIGMLVVPDDIMFKTEPLTNEEINIIKKHPEVGFRLAKLDNSTLGIATTIYQCHENFDGSGYPCGLKGEKINYLARIISIVTAYTKAYRKNRCMGDEAAYIQAIGELMSTDKHDPIIKRQFIDYMKESREIIKKGLGE